MNDNFMRSGEVIKNIQRSKMVSGGVANVYAYAFGMVWANLTDEQQQHILDRSEQMAKEQK